MNIDLHSHFFPIEALSNPGKYREKAPKIELDKGKLKVTSKIGMRRASVKAHTKLRRGSKRWTK